jgi:dTMP kinase
VRGAFISFEGIEGSGKSTYAELLLEHLRAKGFHVVKVAEPGGTSIGMKIRGLLLSPENGAITPLVELLLYNASRVQLIDEVIAPALKRGDIVISDRFSDSTVAYQGFGRGIDLKLIHELDLLSTGRLRPDLTILLDLDVEVGLKRNRRADKDDRLEREDVSFHNKVREGFINIATRETERMRLVDASGHKEAVYKKVEGIVDEFLLRETIGPQKTAD